MEFVAFFAGHEFHENDPWDLDVIGSKYNFRSLTPGLLTRAHGDA